MDKVEKVMQELEKTAVKDSSYLADILAGAEPTGVYTYKNALKNKKNHGKHKFFGDVGGFVGGAAISTALSGAAAYGLGKLVKNKDVGKALKQMGKDQFRLFNPKKVLDTMKKIPEATKTQKEVSNITSTIAKVHASKNVGGIDLGAELKRSKSALDSAKVYKDKHGESQVDTLRKGLGIMSGAAAGLLGGALNAGSAHAQYNVGKKNQKKGVK